MKNEYTFGIKKSKDSNYHAVVLEDDTTMMLSKKNNTMSIMFPKKKFTRIFKKQMKDRKRHYLGVQFSYQEVSALLKGVEWLHTGKLPKKCKLVKK